MNKKTVYTANDVCKTLGNHLKEEIIFIDEQFRIKNKRELSGILVILYNDNTIGFNVPLPSHIIQMIITFYDLKLVNLRSIDLINESLRDMQETDKLHDGPKTLRKMRTNILKNDLKNDCDNLEKNKKKKE